MKITITKIVSLQLVVCQMMATALQIVNNTSAVTLPPPQTLSRHKRYLSFPEGSSFSCAVCLSIGMYGNPQFDFISWAVNWGVAYNLPNTTWFQATHFQFLDLFVEPPAAQARRYRRGLYEQFEIALNSMGYNGRECVLQALCDSAQIFGKAISGNVMVHEMLKTIFTMPKSKVMSFEHTDLVLYDHAHRQGRSGRLECGRLFPKCGISFVKAALGWYRKQSGSFKNYM